MTTFCSCHGVLPGGRNFGQKARKGLEKYKVGQKKLWPNFGQMWPKVTEKVWRIFSKEVPYLTAMTHFQRQRKTSISFWTDPSCVCWIDVFVQLAELFPKLAEIFLCTGRKIISGHGNTVATTDRRWAVEDGGGRMGTTRTQVLRRSGKETVEVAAVDNAICKQDWTSGGLNMQLTQYSERINLDTT